MCKFHDSMLCLYSSTLFGLCGGVVLFASIFFPSLLYFFVVVLHQGFG